MSPDDQAVGQQGVRYDAFISYSHAADGLLAPRLQSALQRFAKPWWKRRAMRVFRDESSLSANPHLWSSITDALDASAWFVLLLSPDAASSEWVNQEVEYWLEHKYEDRILPVVTEGEFGPALLPPALVFDDEPRWVDLRFARSDRQLDLKNPTFSAAVADIASAVRALPKDELESEEVKQHRRTLRTAWAAGVALGALAIAAIALGIAARNGQTAATVNELAAEAVNAADLDPQRAILLALEALELSDGESIAAQRALRLALSQHRLTGVMQLPDGLPRAQGLGLAFHEGRNELVVTADGSTILFIDARTLSILRQVVIDPTIRQPTGGFPDIDFSPDGSMVVSVDTAGRVNVVDSNSAALLWSVEAADVGPGIAKFSPDGSRIAFAGYAEPENLFLPMSVGVIDTASRERLWTTGIVTPNDLEFADDGASLVVGTWASNLAEFVGEVIVLETDTGEESNRRSVRIDNLAAIAVDTERRRIWEAGAGARIRVRDLDSLDVIAEIRTRESVLDLSVNANNTVVVSGSLPATAWDAETFAEIARVGGADSAYGASAVTADGSTLIAADVASQTIERFRIDRVGPGELFSAEVDLEPFGIEVSPDSLRIAVSSIPAGVLHEFHYPSGEVLTQTAGIHRFPFGGVAYSSDGARIVTQDQDGVRTSGLFLAPGVSADPDIVFEDTTFAGVMTPSLYAGDTMVAGGIGTLVRTWDARSGDLMAEFDIKAIVGAVAVDDQGESLIAGSCVTNDVKVFSLPSLTIRLEVPLPGCQSRVNITGDGALFGAASQDAGVGVWRTDDGTEVLRTQDPAYSVEFSPDARRVAVGRLDGVVQEFDTTTGILLQEWSVGRGGAAEVTYMPDGDALAVGYIGGAVRVFALDRDDLIDIARDRLFRSWTDEECELFRLADCA